MTETTVSRNEVVDYYFSDADATALGLSLGDDEHAPMIVTAVDGETGVYGGYVFLPGGGGIQYRTVDPNTPEPVAPQTDEAKRQEEIDAAVNAALARRDAADAKASTTSPPATPEDVPASQPGETDTPTFSGVTNGDNTNTGSQTTGTNSTTEGSE